jgi:hypothetical protein
VQHLLQHTADERHARRPLHPGLDQPAVQHADRRGSRLPGVRRALHAQRCGRDPRRASGLGAAPRREDEAAALLPERP